MCCPEARLQSLRDPKTSRPGMPSRPGYPDAYGRRPDRPQSHKSGSSRASRSGRPDVDVEFDEEPEPAEDAGTGFITWRSLLVDI